MSPRRAIFAALFAAFAAAPAGAQFQATPMRFSAPRDSVLGGGKWSGASGSDLAVIQPKPGVAGQIYPYRDLLGATGQPYAGPSLVLAGAIGPFDGSVSGLIPDAVWGYGTGLSVAWGASPGTSPPPSWSNLFVPNLNDVAPVRLLARPQPVLLATVKTPGTIAPLPEYLYAVDLASSRVSPSTPPTRQWPQISSPDFDPAADGDVYHDRILPLRLSPAAVAASVEDAIVPFAKGFYLLWHDAVPASTLAASAITGGAFGAPGSADLTPFLPSSVQDFPFGSVLGAAAIDVDGDGAPDLVFSYADVLFSRTTPPFSPCLTCDGRLLWIRNGGTLAGMQAQQPWGILSGRSDLGAIIDATTLRQIELDSGEPAFAVHDRTRGKIVIVRGGGGAGFTTSEVSAANVRVREMKTLDVVGTPARDLVVLVDLPPNYLTSELWVFPDEGDAMPTLGWIQPLPAEALLGFPLTISVAASDPDYPPLDVRWTAPPTSTASGATLSIPGSALCDPASTLGVTVRAVDALGVFARMDGSAPVVARPSLTLVGSDAPGRLVLSPGGVSGRAEGTAWPGCQSAPPAYTWTATALGGMVRTGEQPAGSAGAWLDFALPESAYPEALSGAPALTLGASGNTPVSSPQTGSATLLLRLDGRALVDVSVSFDQAALSAGDLGVARARLANRVGVPIPRVLATVRLDGLSLAGSPVVKGAPSESAGTGRVVIDPLPAAGAVVEVAIPVRSIGAPGGVSVELTSAGGFPLSPEAAPTPEGVSAPGCGCGGGGGALLAPAVLFALALPATRRRSPPPT